MSMWIWPIKVRLITELEYMRGKEKDLEKQLDATRRWLLKNGEAK